jgi:coproporphyrinogen III oxidase-like Fe-S oxidoreductase
MRRSDTRDEAQRELETLMLELRTSRGMPLSRLSCPPHIPLELEKQGLAGRDGDRLVLTDRGFLLLNDILLRLTRAA